MSGMPAGLVRADQGLDRATMVGGIVQAAARPERKRPEIREAYLRHIPCSGANTVPEYIHVVQWPDCEQTVAAYLIRHPEAQDTVEGITNWWLTEQRIQFVAAEVSHALAALTEKGFLLTTRQRDGRVMFRLNPERRAAMAEWLTRPNQEAPRTAAHAHRRSRRN